MTKAYGNGYVYSNENKGHIGIKKVVLAFGEFQYPYNDYDGKLEKKDYYTGREIMSTIIPNVNYENTDDWGNHCVIERGIIKEGKVAANALGSSSSGLIQQTYNIYGHEECSHFLNKVQTQVENL